MISLSVIGKLILVPLIFLLSFCSVLKGGLEASSSIFDSLNEDVDAMEIIKLVDAFYERVKDYSATFLKQERIDGRLLSLERIEYKFRKPNDIYMKWLNRPYKGQEAIYRQGNGTDKMTVHKGGLLGVFTLNIDPKGARAMKNQHHPIYESGIGATIALVKRGLLTGIKRKEYDVSYEGKKLLDGRETMVIEGRFPERCEGITHTVQEGENLWVIAEKYNQDMYVILHNNDRIRDPKDIKAGTKLLVPYHYCQRIVIYIDRESAILVKVDIFDWEGNLYETYQYTDLKINLGLTDRDFSSDNPAYNF